MSRTPYTSLLPPQSYHLFVGGGIININLLIQFHVTMFMRLLLSIILWFILLVLCWPLALLAVLIWIILLPFQLLGFAVGGVFKLAGAIILLPFRLAGYGSRR